MPSDRLQYRVTDGHLAEGGMAVLSKISLPGGGFAVLRELQRSKLLRFDLRRRFISGVMTRRDLSPHPCIVNSLEVGRHFLTPYEIIEYVDGVPLRNLMTLDARRVRDDAEFILREMAQGLAWVHTCGMMHLDVKPENFLVKKQGDHFTVKLTDFDMARKKDDNGPRKILGTPGFMAPEQFNQKLSYQASDVFAFGLIAYQIVTCKLPFSGKTQKETWRQQASPNVQPRPIHELVPNVNQKLEHVIINCLQKPLQRRYDNMAQVLQALS